MKNPNAVIGGGSGLTVGSLVVYALSLVHVTVSAYVGIAIASGVAGVVLWVGRSGGLAGVWHKIMYGDPPPAPPT